MASLSHREAHRNAETFTMPIMTALLEATGNLPELSRMPDITTLHTSFFGQRENCDSTPAG